MFSTANLIRPITLELRKEYLRFERQVGSEVRDSDPVLFIAFDPSPAFVIIQNSDGTRIRCPSDEIYLSPDNRGEEATG